MMKTQPHGRRSIRLKRRHAVAIISIGCVTLIFILNMKYLSTTTTSFFVQGALKILPDLMLSTTVNSFIKCDRSHREYDFCTAKGRVRLHQSESIFILESPVKQILVEKLRPFPRKWENHTIIKEVTLATSPDVIIQPCRIQHDAPALVFSAGGYTGNFFHDFNDRFIPLFITINNVYNGSDDVVLVISDAQNWWVQKYSDLLNAFSKHPIIDLDRHNTSHCFPAVSIGLMSHGLMKIDPNQVSNGKNFSHFHTFLHNAFATNASYKLNDKLMIKPRRPRLVLSVRSGTGGRVILNQNELTNLATDEGFEVIKFEPNRATSLKKTFNLLQSSDVFIGVHGAALTHLLFLRHGTIFIQIVPIGTDWVSKVCFGEPAKTIGLDYVEYEISVNESSLLEMYGTEHPLVKDPVGSRGGWKIDVMDVYLKEQNVKMELGRFRGYLKSIYRKTSLDKV